MKGYLYSSNRRVVYEVESNSIQGLHDAVARIQNSLTPNEKCGLCNSVNVARLTRGQPGRQFRGLQCQACGAELSYGYNANDVMFPLRTDQFKRKLPNNGWRQKTEAADAQD